MFVDAEHGVVVLLFGSVEVVLDLDADSHVSEQLFVAAGVQLVIGVVVLVIAAAAEHLNVVVETDVVGYLLSAVPVAVVFVIAIVEHTEHQSSAAELPVEKDHQYNFVYRGFAVVVVSLIHFGEFLAVLASSLAALLSQHYLL